MTTTIRLTEEEIRKAVVAYILKEIGVYAEQVQFIHCDANSEDGYTQAEVTCKGRKAMTTSDMDAQYGR